MADIWFYTRGGKQMDPVSTPELKQLASRGLLKPTDMVWKEGMPQWVRASSAMGLFDDQPRAGSGAGRPGVESSRRSGPQQRGVDRDDGMGYSGSRQGQSKGLGTGAKVAIVMGVVLLLGGLAVAAVLLKMNSGAEPHPVAVTKVMDKKLIEGGPGKDAAVLPFVPKDVIDSYEVTIKDLADDKRFVEVKAGARYEVTATSDRGCNLDVYIDDEMTREVAKTVNAAGTGKVAFTPMATGRYRIEVVNMGKGDSKFNVVVRSLGADLGGPFAKVDPVAPVPVVPGLVTSYKVRIEDLKDDRRMVDLKGGVRYEITAKSDIFCMMDLYLDDATGREVAQHLNAPGTGKITFTPIFDGQHRIEVVNMGKGDSNFAVEVRSAGGALPAGRFVAATKVGARINDSLTNFDARDPADPGCFCKVFQVQMMAGRTYTIDYIHNGFMGGGRFDPFLRLVDSRDLEVATDDDGGGGLNSRIFYGPPRTDTYRIVCTTLGPNTTGGFTLIVREN